MTATSSATSSMTQEELIRVQAKAIRDQGQTITQLRTENSANQTLIGANGRAITLMQQTIQARDAELTRTLGHIQGVRQIHLNELANIQARHDRDIFWGGVKGITAAAMILLATVSTGKLPIGAGCAGFVWGGCTGMAGIVLGGAIGDESNVRQQRRAATLASQLILPPAQ